MPEYKVMLSGFAHLHLEHVENKEEAREEAQKQVDRRADIGHPERKTIKNVKEKDNMFIVTIVGVSIIEDITAPNQHEAKETALENTDMGDLEVDEMEVHEQ